MDLAKVADKQDAKFILAWLKNIFVLQSGQSWFTRRRAYEK